VQCPICLIRKLILSNEFGLTNLILNLILKTCLVYHTMCNIFFKPFMLGRIWPNSILAQIGSTVFISGVNEIFPLAGILYIGHYIIFLFTLGSSEITSVEAPKPYLRHNFERLYCDNYTSDLSLMRLVR
jgi:hypothetical protein